PFHVSPLGRTQDTATIAGRYINLPHKAVVEPRLQEVSTGSWDGLTQEEIEAGWPGALAGTDHYDWYFRSPDGETLDSVLHRIQSWLGELEGPVVAVSHGLFGRLVRGTWLGLPTREMLCLPVPQDVVWHLSQAGVHPLSEA
ncbi:MAG: histidine phosphatase family protein, partial [Janthinobacterium lividum]